MTWTESTPSVPSTEDYYLARPESGKGRPVLVLHAWWGLNQFIKEFCNRLAKEGFVTLAPDLFNGAVGTTVEEAERISSRFEADRAAQDRLSQRIKQAAELLQAIGGPSTREIGVVAFSFGGWWTIWLANQKDNPVAAAVLFYATGEGDFAHSHAAFQFHLAATDPYESPAKSERASHNVIARSAFCDEAISDKRNSVTQRMIGNVLFRRTAEIASRSPALRAAENARNGS